MIREAHYSDIDNIIKLENEVLGESLGYNMLTSLIDNELTKLYVLEDNGLVGYISISFDGSVLEIYNICIAVEKQNKGYGKVLLGKIITIYSFQADTIFLEVRRSNAKAIALYKYFNFKEINVRRNYYNGEDALVFEKVITKYDDVQKKIVDQICNHDLIDGIDRYYTIDNPYSYQYNFYDIKDNLIENIDKIKSNPDPRIKNIVISYSGDNIDIEGFSRKKTISMYASLPVIKITKETDKTAKLLDNNDYGALEEYLYQSNLKYGTTYAKLNSEHVIKKLKSGIENIIACYKDDKIIGIGKFTAIDNAIYFSDYVVYEEYQGQGYGMAIFKELLNYAKANKLIDIFLEADCDDTYKEMYYKMGFEYGSIYTEYVECKENN